MQCEQFVSCCHRCFRRSPEARQDGVLLSQRASADRPVIQSRHRFEQLLCVYCSSDLLTGRHKGGFVKGWFRRMCPRSGFRSRGTCERTLVPVYVPGEHPNVPSFRFSFRGNICQNHPFGKPPFCQPPILCANYDGFLWIFPRDVIRIRMNSRNSLYNAPSREVSN